MQEAASCGSWIKSLGFGVLGNAVFGFVSSYILPTPMWQIALVGGGLLTLYVMYVDEISFWWHYHGAKIKYGLSVFLIWFVLPVVLLAIVGLLYGKQ